MAENSSIEWTDHTFNPWEGCQKVGPGCDHCYAEARNARFGGGQAINWGPGAPRRRTSAANWRKPLAWNAAHAEFFAEHGRRQRVFCASLADVFDNEVGNTWRSDLLGLIYDTPNLDWLLLTKRIGNVPRLMDECTEPGKQWKLPPNVWMGATFCNQDEWNRDADKLFAIPAQVHFGSFEPLLSEIDLLQCPECGGGGETWGHYFTETGSATCQRCHGKGVRPYLDLGWTIVGGESGHGARPMHPDWARSLRDQCAAAGVPFLFKQWGEWTPDDPGEEIRVFDYAGILPDGDAKLATQGYRAPFDDGERLKAAGNVRLDGRTLMHRVGKKAAGRLLDGVQHDGYPEIEA